MQASGVGFGKHPLELLGKDAQHEPFEQKEGQYSDRNPAERFHRKCPASSGACFGGDGLGAKAAACRRLPTDFYADRIAVSLGGDKANMAQLGVNIDHVATVRQARRTYEPDPVWAAALAELGGADGITLHLREDRRHIQDRDLKLLRETVTVKLNLEMACEDDVCRIACEVGPDQVTLVPENRQEVTTEGGLDVVTHRDRAAAVMARLREKGITVSLFLDADARQIDTAQQLGADAVELHTGQYALARPGKPREAELAKLTAAGKQIVAAGMILHAGHGLNYQNARAVADIPQMGELNIGHSIVARAVMIGMREAVREMKQLIT